MNTNTIPIPRELLERLTHAARMSTTMGCTVSLGLQADIRAAEALLAVPCDVQTSATKILTIDSEPKGYGGLYPAPTPPETPEG